jgi:hypothetical protein
MGERSSLTAPVTFRVEADFIGTGVWAEVMKLVVPLRSVPTGCA